MNEFEKLMQKHLLLRRDLREASEKETPAEDAITKLQNEIRSVEDQIAKLRVNEEREEDTTKPPVVDVDKPNKELTNLVNDCKIANIVDATLNQRNTDGREAEVQQELKLNANQIPVELIMQRAVTPIPAQSANAHLGTTQTPILPVVFGQRSYEYLNVETPTVPAGQRTYPVLAAGASASTPAKAASVAESTGGFNLTSLEPKRIQASFFFNLEDASTFVGMEESLRMNLNDALMDKLDDVIVDGLIANGTDQDLTSAEITYATAIQSAYDSIDGKHATMLNQLRYVVGSATYKRLNNVYRTAQSDISAVDWLQSQGVMIRVSDKVAAVASKKQKCIIRLGMDPSVYAPIWQGVTLIPDSITKAATGQTVLTAIMLYAFAVVRKGFVRIPEYTVSA